VWLNSSLARLMRWLPLAITYRLTPRSSCGRRSNPPAPVKGLAVEARINAKTPRAARLGSSRADSGFQIRRSLSPRSSSPFWISGAPFFYSLSHSATPP
jgi:hypothetical protein